MKAGCVSRLTSRPAVLALAGALIGCAPATTPALITDPIFAQGQLWVMTPTGGTAGAPRTMTVGNRHTKTYATAFYEPTISRDNGKVIADSFVFDPLDADPEFIFALRIVREGESDTQEICLVRTPGAVTLGQPLKGVYARTLGKAGMPQYFNSYVETGQADGLPTCTLTRTR